MSVIIALIGIVNTLSLSILERRRELGLLRVVGMTDKRVQRMVRLESVLIAAARHGHRPGPGRRRRPGADRVDQPAQRRERQPSLPWLDSRLSSWPAWSLGLLASLIPARRSTSLEVLDAIQST